MGQYISIISIISIWFISFVEPSGWSIAIHLPEKINIALLIISIFFYIASPQNRQQISSYLVLLVITTFIFLPVMQQDSWQGASYLVSFLTVYIVSQGEITHKVIRYTGLAIAGLGLIILLIYSRGSLLSGWNDNAMSMVGLFSFLYFSIFLILEKGTNKFWIWNIVTFIYIALLFGTECRSGMLFGIMSVVGILFSNKVINIFNKNWFPLLLLNLPLLIAFLVIWVSESSYFQELNDWSLQEFNKQIFNGRDTLWDYAIKLLEKSDYLGTGKFMMNYHNSGVAALSAFGIVGYISWILYFNNIFLQLRKYLKDEIVFGSLFAFCLIFLQQSLDLGLIAEYPNLLPYMILGVGLGRVRMLKNEELSYL